MVDRVRLQRSHRRSDLVLFLNQTDPVGIPAGSLFCMTLWFMYYEESVGRYMLLNTKDVIHIIIYEPINYEETYD